MSEPMTGERRKEFDRLVGLKLPCSYAEIRECLKEIDRLKEKLRRAKIAFPNSVEINRELGVRCRQLREEIDRLKEENEDMRSKITGMFAGFCPPEEAMVLREATAKAEEENRKARELLEHIAMDVASLLGEES